MPGHGGSDLSQVQAGAEVVAVAEHHADAQFGLLVQQAVRGGELVDRSQVHRIPLVGPVQPDEQHVAVAVDRHSRLTGRVACHARTLTARLSGR